MSASEQRSPKRPPSAMSARESPAQDKNAQSDRNSRSVSSMSEGGESSSEEDTSWISWFCSLKGHDLFTEVDEAFIEDEFNLHGLQELVPNYEFAKDLILDLEVEYKLSPEQAAQVERSAELLYGLIHARFIITPRGLEQMLEKYQSIDFGRCPRVFCEGQPALPMGQSDLPRESLCKLFCPRCNDIFYPPVAKHSRLDGAYFGSTFPHLFLQTYPELLPDPPRATFVPRVFGFKLHSSYRQNLLEEAEEKRRRVRTMQRTGAGRTSASPSPTRTSGNPPPGLRHSQEREGRLSDKQSGQERPTPSTTPAPVRSRSGSRSTGPRAVSREREKEKRPEPTGKERGAGVTDDS